MDLTATNESDADAEFTEIVRGWLANDTTGTRNYQIEPVPGWYKEGGEVILLDGDLLYLYDDGAYHYYAQTVN